MHKEAVLALESLIEAINVHLEVGNWAEVVHLTVPLYEQAIAAGDPVFAELVQDMHWIANDALAHPLEIGRVVQP